MNKTGVALTVFLVAAMAACVYCVMQVTVAFRIVSDLLRCLLEAGAHC